MQGQCLSPIGARGALTRVLLVFLLLPLAGCPLFQAEVRFSSADVATGGALGRGLDSLAEGTSPADADDGGGGGEPRDIVEPDVIRRDGHLLYILNQYRGLTIVDLDTDSILSQVPTYGFPRDLYVENGRAFVIVSWARDFEAQGETLVASIGSRLFVIDTQRPEEASIIASFELEGDLIDSRLVGDILYVVSAQFAWYILETDVAKQQTSASWVTSIDIADPNNIVEVERLSFDGLGNVIHATASAIFVAAPDWAADSTVITVVDISDPAGALSIDGAVTVRGYVADRFKMDAWNGALRVVSSAREGRLREVYVTTIDLAGLGVLAEMRLENASGDALFATRFDGPRAYVVTYFVVDPLFVLDLSDPARPQVLGELEVPGFSTHIEPRGDVLIAMGVDDTDGRSVNVSLFDVSGPPALLDRVTFGEGWSWSTAFYDFKALTILDDVIIVPFSGWSESEGRFERLQFISYTLDDLRLRGLIDLDGTILRSFEYAGSFYGVTTEQLARIDGSNLDEPVLSSSLTLAENVTDIIEVRSGLAAEIIFRYDDNVTLLRTVDESLETLGDLSLDIGNYTNVFVSGDTVIVIGADWYETPKYTIAAVDVSEPSSPILKGTLDVLVTPFLGYYFYGPYFGGGGGFAEVGVVADRAFAPWYPVWGATESQFQLGGVLALRCFAERYDTVFGDLEPQEGLAIVDVSALEWESTLGLGFEGITSIVPTGDKLYLGNKIYQDAEAFMPMTANYIRELDVINKIEGPAANVPGIFVQYDRTSGILVLQDYQWRDGYSITSTLKSVWWNSRDLVQPLSTLRLPDFTGRILGAGPMIYADGFDGGYTLRSISLSPGGGLANGSSVLVTKEWGSLLAAKGDNAYVSVAGSVIARYNFTEGAVLAEHVQVMSAPQRIRFGEDKAYAPLGYFGIVTLSQ